MNFKRWAAGCKLYLESKGQEDNLVTSASTWLDGTAHLQCHTLFEGTPAQEWVWEEWVTAMDSKLCHIDPAMVARNWLHSDQSKLGNQNFGEWLPKFQDQMATLDMKAETKGYGGRSFDTWTIQEFE